MDAAKPSGAPLQLSVEATSSTSLQLSWDLPNKWKRNGEIIAAEFQEATKQDGEINCTKYCVVLNCTKCCIVKLYCLYMYYGIMALNLANVHCG